MELGCVLDFQPLRENINWVIKSIRDSRLMIASYGQGALKEFYKSILTPEKELYNFSNLESFHIQVISFRCSAEVEPNGKGRIRN